MSVRVRAALVTAVLLVIVLLLEAYGLRSGTTGVVLVGLVNLLRRGRIR